MQQQIKFKSGFNRQDFSSNKIVHLAKGDTFLYEGDSHNQNCFVLLEGGLDVRLISASGHETLLYSIHPSELVGELAMFGVRERTATLVATRPCQLLEVRYAEFSQLMQDTDFLQKVTHHFLDRYMRTHNVVCRLGQPNIGMRLCRYFQSLAEQYTTEDNLVKLRLPSHAELAKLLSCQRETVTREMKKLALKGVIKPLDKGVMVLNREKNTLFLAGTLES